MATKKEVIFYKIIRFFSVWKGFTHVSSSQNLHETLARLNARKNEQNILLDLKRKTLIGSKYHNQNEH